MTVSTLRLDLRFDPCQSPRESRRQLQAIIDKLHRHFNVSVAGSEAAGPGAAVILVAAAGTTRRDVRETLDRVADAVAAHPRAEVLRHAITEV